MSVLSVSGKNLVLEVRGKSKVGCSLKRHLSPSTVGAIFRSLPLEGHAHMLGKNIIYLDTAIDSGTERPRTEFKKGDVAFMSSSSSICFFLSDTVSKPMTLIGRLSGDENMLKGIVPGDVLCLYEDSL